MKKQLRLGKEKRRKERLKQKEILSTKDFFILNEKLNEQSKSDQLSFKKKKKHSKKSAYLSKMHSKQKSIKSSLKNKKEKTSLQVYKQNYLKVILF